MPATGREGRKKVAGGHFIKSNKPEPVRSGIGDGKHAELPPEPAKG